MDTFCTIITADYFPYSKVLFDSIRSNSCNAAFHVLVTDGNQKQENNHLFYTDTINELLNTEIASRIYKKYAATNTDQFRWALKPVYISWLLNKGYDKVIFLDPDLYFVSSPEILLKELDTASVILTPHWNNPNPLSFEDGLFSIMRNGMFNAGFAGASGQGKDAMNWWAEMCHYKTEKLPELGIYDDQKYLDLLPIEFENVRILKQRGYNLASWNIDSSKREIVNGKLMINFSYEPVFIHFTKSTIEHIVNGNDALLRPYLDRYIAELKKAGVTQPRELPKENIFHLIKRKTLLRTRFKRFLFKLAEKL